MNSGTKQPMSPAVVKLTRADLKTVMTEENPKGCDLLKAGVLIGKKRKTKVIVLHDQAFNSSSYGYSGFAVLIDTAHEKVFPQHILVGKKSIPVEENTFVVLKQKHAISYLKESN